MFFGEINWIPPFRWIGKWFLVILCRISPKVNGDGFPAYTHKEVVRMKCTGTVRILVCCCLIIGLASVGIISAQKAVEALREAIPVPRIHTIVIDAGHGGEDGGATSCTGRLESEYNLEISMRLMDMMHLLGYRTKMIRKSDTAIYTKGETISQKKVDDLKQRVRITNQSEGNVLLSIHQNYFSQGQFSGAQVFYADNDSSRNLADAIQKGFQQTINPGSRRKTKAGKGIYLLEKCSVCGVLVECGFLSNQREAYLLGQSDYQKKLVCVIGATVASNLS